MPKSLPTTAMATLDLRDNEARMINWNWPKPPEVSNSRTVQIPLHRTSHTTNKLLLRFAKWYKTAGRS
jgi:hypothetical protein